MALKTNTKKNAESLPKFKLKFDVGMSDVLVKYAMSKYPSKFHLSNLNKMLDLLDLTTYKYNYEIYSNLLLTKSLSSKLSIAYSASSSVKPRYSVNNKCIVSSE